jgi:hypothetical protein
MRVEFSAEQTRTKQIVESDEVRELIRWALLDQANMALLARAIRRYRNLHEFSHGTAAIKSFKVWVTRFQRRSRRSDGKAQIIAVMEEYADRGGDLSNVRGALIEAMAFYRLSGHYPPERVMNNVFVHVFEPAENGDLLYRSERSIDVAACDGHRGEFLYCKAQARYVESDVIEEMVDELESRAFRVGIVCADDAAVARHTLALAHPFRNRVAVIGADLWWTGLPVHRG